MMEPTEGNQEIHYTRDQPIWWLHAMADPDRAVFVAHRKKKVVIDVMLPDGMKQRRLTKIAEIQPRDEEKEQPKRTEKRFTEQQLAACRELFPGFEEWYKANYDAEGNLKPATQRPAIPRLRPPHLLERQQGE